jgi:hypothetical protein
MIVKTKSTTMFVLIQGDVVDEAATPSFLRFDRVNENKDFQVAVGCINESGKKEIHGVVANSIPRPGATSYRISSEIDGQGRRIGASLPAAEIMRQRLSVYWQKGRFADLSNLPQIIVVMGIE